MAAFVPGEIEVLWSVGLPVVPDIVIVHQLEAALLIGEDARSRSRKRSLAGDADRLQRHCGDIILLVERMGETGDLRCHRAQPTAPGKICRIAVTIPRAISAGQGPSSYQVPRASHLSKRCLRARPTYRLACVAYRSRNVASARTTSENPTIPLKRTASPTWTSHQTLCVVLVGTDPALDSRRVQW